MNRVQRNSEDKQANRAVNKNNINILINFNVKDKNSGLIGKKLDNFIEIEQKGNIKNELSHQNEDIKNGKRKNIDTIDSKDREKLLETPIKNKLADKNKIKEKRIGQKGGEKTGNLKRQDHSKSQGKKMIKRKVGKSMQNIRVSLKDNKVKQKSSSKSPVKSHSHSQSSKKINRSNKQSLKNLLCFTNIGIKNKINKSKTATQNNSREKIFSTVNHRSKEDDEKIKRFMEEKKKKQKSLKEKQAREERLKKQKRENQLKKVELERKANASKPYNLSKKLEQKQQKFPIYFFDDDEEFDESNEYEQLKKDANNLLQQAESNELKQTIFTYKQPSHPSASKPQKQNSSTKNQIKRKSRIRRSTLVDQYLRGEIDSNDLDILEGFVIKIQSFWRGYQVRQQFISNLRKQENKIRTLKNRVLQSNGAYWQQQSDNSIINIQKLPKKQAIEHSGRDQSEQYSDKKYINYFSSSSDQKSNYRSEGLSNLINEYNVPKQKKIEILIDEEKDSNNSDQNKITNDKIMKEIEELKRQLQHQNLKFRTLEEQNQNLKKNIEHLQNSSALKENQESQQPIEMTNSIDFFPIRMPKKIEDNSDAQKSKQKHSKDEKQIMSDGYGKTEGLKTDSFGYRIDSFKKQFENYQCSPTNALMQEKIKQLKDKNLHSVFKKKEIKIESKYEKKFQLFDRLLKDNTFSPRTYNFKKKELESKMVEEKLEIKTRLQEAKRVVGFIQDISDDQDDNFERKQKKQLNNFPNEVPSEKLLPIQVEGKKDNNESSEIQSQEERIYKKYWTDDIEQIHKHTLEITKKIDEALKADSQSSKNKQSEFSSQHYSGDQNIQNYQSLGAHSEGYQKKKQSKKHELEIKDEKNNRIQASIEIKEQYEIPESIDENISEIRIKPNVDYEAKAKEIFNKIDLSNEEECKSQEESNQNICEILNKKKKENTTKKQNLYISQSEFNKKRKEEQLSRSSSFEDRNSSSVGNNSSLVPSKGFITNLTFIKQFCISICQYIRSNQGFKQQFILNICQKIKFDSLEYLKSYRTTVSNEYRNNYNSFKEDYLYVYFKSITTKIQAISQALFLQFLKAYQKENELNPKWNDSGLKSSMLQSRQFFLISIIDAFNESLEYERPGSIYGEPLPWLNNIKILKNYNTKNLKLNLENKEKAIDNNSQSGSSLEQLTAEEQKLDHIFGAAIAKMIQWGSCLCGFIADPMPMEMGQSQIGNITQEQVNSIRETRVGLMLQKWLVEEEQKITDPSAEFTQVLLDLSQKMVEELINEALEDFELIQTK